MIKEEQTDIGCAHCGIVQSWHGKMCIDGKHKYKARNKDQSDETWKKISNEDLVLLLVAAFAYYKDLTEEPRRSNQYELVQVYKTEVLERMKKGQIYSERCEKFHGKTITIANLIKELEKKYPDGEPGLNCMIGDLLEWKDKQ